MANVHILTIDGAEVLTVMHFAVPNTNNSSGINWRVIAARVHGTTSLPDGDGTGGTISTGEKTSITTGALVEQMRFIKLGTDNPSGAQIDAAFTAEQSAFQTSFQAKYARYGATRG